MARYSYIVGYQGIVQGDKAGEPLTGPLAETQMRAIEAFMTEYPNVQEHVIRVRTLRAVRDTNVAAG
jgi:hypothetical protein